MKIVNRETFLKLPAGTIYLEYSRHNFGELCVKEDTYVDSNDFTFRIIAAEVNAQNLSEELAMFERALEKNESICLDFNCTMRDGKYEEKQLYAIYEEQDIDKLIAVVLDAKKRGYGSPEQTTPEQPRRCIIVTFNGKRHRVRVLDSTETIQSGDYASAELFPQRGIDLPDYAIQQLFKTGRIYETFCTGDLVSAHENMPNVPDNTPRWHRAYFRTVSTYFKK
jgi:hypothetical protein